MSRQRTNIRLNTSDFYPTPSWCYKNLEIDWSQYKTAHEPAAGDGRLVHFLREKGIETTYSEIREGQDFFDYTEHTDLIITNPPFSLALEFVEHALPLADTVIMLLRLNFLASIKRYEWFKHNSPVALHVLSKRPSFTGSGTDATDYAWFMWGYAKPGIYFVQPPTNEQAKLDNESCKKALKNDTRRT